MAESQSDSLHEIREAANQFARERDWFKFHTPKNLATALTVEAAELLENFQWLEKGTRAELSEARLENVRQEAADVLILLVRLADTLDIDLAECARAKLEMNKQKYPAGLVRGDARKYDEYDQ